MTLSIVLVNFNGRSCITDSVSALGRNTSTSDFEIIVVDSGSADESWMGLEEQFERVRVIRFGDNIGFCAGCNRGAEAAGGEFIAFVNFDGIVEPEWDVPLLEALNEPDVTVAGGMLVDTEGTTVEAVGLGVAINMATYGLLEGHRREDVPLQRRQVPAVSGALMMARREAFLACGGFNEALWMYGDEIDLCLRMGGRVLVAPRSAIRHEVGHAAGPKLSPLRTYWSSRNRLINANRHLPRGPMAKAIATSLAFDVLAIATTRHRETARAAVRGWADGVRAVRDDRMSRSVAERERAAESLTSFRGTFRQYRTLRRDRSS